MPELSGLVTSIVSNGGVTVERYLLGARRLTPTGAPGRERTTFHAHGKILLTQFDHRTPGALRVGGSTGEQGPNPLLGSVGKVRAKSRRSSPDMGRAWRTW